MHGSCPTPEPNPSCASSADTGYWSDRIPAARASPMPSDGSSERPASMEHQSLRGLRGGFRTDNSTLGQSMSSKCGSRGLSRVSHSVAQPVLRLIVMVLLLGADTGHAQPATRTKTPTATPTATTTPTGRAAIAGLVYRDSNANALFDGREEGIDDVQLTLERIDVVEKARTAKSDSKGKYRFDDVAVGSYLLTLRVPSNYRATTTTRRDAVVVSFLGGVEDFGLQ